MNNEWSFMFFLFFFIYCINIGSKTTEAKSEKIDQIVAAEAGENVTLLCNPSLRENFTLSSLVSNVEWRTDNDIPVFTDGKLWQYVFDYYNDVDNSSIAIDNNPPGTLILRKVSTMINNMKFTCTFFTPSTKVSYTYLLQVTEYYKYSTSFYSSSPIQLRNPGDRVVLPCAKKSRIAQPTSTPLTIDFSYTWLSRKSKPNSLEKIEVISLNRTILLKNNPEGYQVAEDRSLIIPSLTPSWTTDFECHTSLSQVISHHINGNENDQSDFDYAWNNISIAVEQGNDVSLNCPVGNANFVWIRNTTELLFVNERAVKSSKTDNLKIDYDKRLLNITNFSLSSSGIYTCSGTNGENYQYNVTKRAGGVNKVLNGTDIIGENISLDCPSSSTSDSFAVWTRSSQNTSNVEVLFINGLIAGGNKNDKLKTANNGRSLLIYDFSYTLGGVYVCGLDTGINSTFHIIVPDEFRDWSVTNLKKKSFPVDYGTRNLVLPCPSILPENTNSSYQWFMSNSYNRKSVLLFLNQEKFVYGTMLPPNSYEINDDGSLVILVVRQFQYGEYTCKRSTDEQYVYNLYREYKWINETIFMKSNTSSITLPCPINDPRDRDFNLIFWSLNSPSGDIFGEFIFVDGKMMPSQPFKIPENIKLADDKTSLIISNITSTNSFSGEYFCGLAYSSTIYRYLLIN